MDHQVSHPRSIPYGRARGIAIATLHATRELTLDLTAIERLPDAIRGMTALIRLSLDATRCRDVRALAGHPSLRALLASKSPITDLGFARDVQLDQLVLSYGRVADLAPLTGHPTLASRPERRQTRLTRAALGARR